MAFARALTPEPLFTPVPTPPPPEPQQPEIEQPFDVYTTRAR